MPRVNRRLSVDVAHVVATIVVLGAAAACGAVDLGSHSRDLRDGGGTGDLGDGSSDGGTSPIGAACGSRGLQPCAPDLFCRHEVSAQCGALDQPGTCVTVPTVCTSDLIDVKVCGCDGATYPNLCSATFARVSVRSEGECPPGADGGAGAACGARGLSPCPSPQVCIYPPAATCGELDKPGTCRTLVPGSSCPAVFDPVCGCDGKSYSNECAANLAGASVRSTGACP